MNRIIENLKVNNPAIYQILQEQEKQKWEITSGTRYKTVSDTVSANSPYVSTVSILCYKNSYIPLNANNVFVKLQLYCSFV